MGESRVWIIASIVAVAISGMAFAGYQEDAQTKVLIIGFASSICISLLTYMQSIKTAIKQDVATRKAEYTANLVQENAVAVDERLGSLTNAVTDTAKTVKKVEIQTNSSTGALLRRSAEVLRRYANSTKDPIDEAIALSAEKDFADHERGQAIIADGAADPEEKPAMKDVHLDVVADAQATAKNAQATAKGAQAVAKNLTEGAK